MIRTQNVRLLMQSIAVRLRNRKPLLQWKAKKNTSPEVRQSSGLSPILVPACIDPRIFRLLQLCVIRSPNSYLGTESDPNYDHPVTSSGNSPIFPSFEQDSSIGPDM